jgi:hypothetical protein
VLGHQELPLAVRIVTPFNVATPYRSTLLKTSREFSRGNPHDKFLIDSSLTRVTGNMD